MERIRKAKKIVVKVGTSTVLDENNNLNFKFINGLVKQIKSFGDEKKFIIVSSGAVGLGNRRLNWSKRNDLTYYQCSASVGQNILMYKYSQCFSKYGLIASQFLLTYEDIHSHDKRLRIRKLVNKLLENGIIPIVNGNDSISHDKIRSFDNDLLSAHLSELINVDLLIILTDVNGLYSDFKNKTVITVVDDINDTIRGYIKSLDSVNGKGGMESKLLAAQIASKSNTITIVANGKINNVVSNILNGDRIGTLFYLNGRI